MKIKKKLFASLALLTMLSPQIITPVSVFADDTADASSASSDSSSDDKSDAEGQTADKDAKDILKRLNQKNNIYNSNFPSSARDSLMRKSFKHGKDFQLAVTFAELKGDSDYKDMFEGTGKAIDTFNNLKNGKTINFKSGSQNMVDMLSDATDSSDDDEVSHADKTATSDPGKDSDATNKLSEKIAGLPIVDQAADKITVRVGKAMTANRSTAHGAIALDRRAINGQANKLLSNSQKHDAITNDSKHWVDTGWRHSKNKKADGGVVYTAQLTSGSKNGSLQDSDFGVRSKAGTGSANVSQYSGLKKDIKSALVSHLIANKNKITTAKGMQKELRSVTYKSLANGQTKLLNSNSLSANNGAAGSYAHRTAGHTQGNISYSGFQFMNDAKGNEANYDSGAKSAMAMINPSVVLGVSIPGDDSLFTKLKSATGVNAAKSITVKDSDIKGIKSEVKVDKKASKELDSQTGDLRVLPWTPVYPFSDQQKAKVDKKSPFVLNNYHYTASENNSVAWLQKGAFASDSGMVGKSGLTFKPTSKTGVTKQDWYQKWAKDGDHIVSYKGLPDSNKNNQVYGLDIFGNVINGETTEVAIPYWQASEVFGTGENSKAPVPGQKMTGAFAKAKDDLGSTKDKEIDKIAKGKVASDAKHVRNTLKNSTPTDKASFVQLVNGNVNGGTNGDKYSDKGAAALAVLLTAHYDMGSISKKVMSGAKSQSQLYVGSSNFSKESQSSTDETNLFNATDIVQYIGLRFFNGSFDDLRKTTSAAVSNNYNTTIVENKNGAFFTADQFVGSSMLYNTGLAPFFLLGIVVTLIFIVSAWRIAFRTERLTPGISRVLKLAAILVLTGLLPIIQNLAFNKPTQIVSQKPIMQQALVDQYSRLRQQYALKNVFYSSLFGDKFGGVNKSTDYMIKFYTSETNSGQINKDQEMNANPLTKNNQRDMTVTVNQAAKLWQGNGSTSPLLSVTNKSVDISMMDIFSWASHMTRQKYTAENKPGYTKGNENRYEEPNDVSSDDKDPTYAKYQSGDKWKAGQQPLFDWLVYNYEPVGDEEGVNASDDGNAIQNSLSGDDSSDDSSSDSKSNNDSKSDNNSSDSKSGSWDDRIKKAAKIVGESVTDDQVKTLKSLIKSESGFNEKVDNAGGSGATGLLQYMPATFKAHSIKGHEDIHNADDQLIAWFNNKNWKSDLRSHGPWGPTGGAITKTAKSGSDTSSSDDDKKSDDKSESKSKKSKYNGVFGVDRNIADTSQKSAYEGNDTGRENQIDNSALYQNLKGVHELAVNTKHYSTETEKKLGDKDSAGGMVTGSQSFLKMWQTVFQSGDDGTDKGSMNNFIGLTNVANAINGITGFNSQDNISVKKDNKITQGVDTNFTPGIAGKDALIQEMSMTKGARTIENGSQNNGYSYAARQMMAKFNVSGPKSDYFNLDKNKLYEYYVPYSGDDNGAKKNVAIEKITNKTLTQYITNLSTVRAAIQPSGSTDAGDTNGPVDPFTMAESQLVAMNLWFNMNKQLGYNAFPHMFEANGFSQDAMNRILYVPITEIGKMTDDQSQYNDGDANENSPVRLQDNVGEFFVLRASLPGDLAFMAAQWAETMYGLITGFAVKWLYFAVLILAFIQFWRIRKPGESGQFRELLNGTMAFFVIFGVIKLVHNWLFVYMSESMNNAYVSNSFYKIPLESHAWLQLAIDAIIIWWIIFKYLPQIKKNWRTLGGESTFGQTLQQSVSQMKPTRPSKDLMRGAARKVGRLVTSPISISKKVIRSSARNYRRVRSTMEVGKDYAQRLRDSELITKLSQGKNKLTSGKFRNSQVQKIRDINAAKVDGITPTQSGGLKETDRHLEADTGKMAFQVSAGAANIMGLQRDETGTVQIPMNSVQAQTAAGRKEVVQPVREKLATGIDDLVKANNHPMKLTNYYKVPTYKNTDESISFSVGTRDGVDIEKANEIIRSIKHLGASVVHTPVKLSNGQYSTGTVQIMPSRNFDFRKFQTMLDKSASQLGAAKMVVKTPMALSRDDINQFRNDPNAQRMGIQVTGDNKIIVDKHNVDGKKFINEWINNHNVKNDQSLNDYSQAMTALNDVVLDEDVAKFTPDGGSNMVFRSDNTDAREVAQALSKLNQKPGFAVRTLNAQTALNNKLTDQSGGPQGYVKRLQEHITKDQTIPESKRIDASNTINNFFKENPEDIDFAHQTAAIQSQTVSAMNDLTNKLDDMKILNKAQNGVIRDLKLNNDETVNEINDLRNEINSSSKKSRQMFQNSTVGSIGRHASYTAGAEMGYNPDMNTMSVKRKNNTDFTKNANRGLRHFFNN